MLCREEELDCKLKIFLNTLRNIGIKVRDGIIRIVTDKVKNRRVESMNDRSGCMRIEWM